LLYKFIHFLLYRRAAIKSTKPLEDRRRLEADMSECGVQFKEFFKELKKSIVLLNDKLNANNIRLRCQFDTKPDSNSLFGALSMFTNNSSLR
jgi:hypothetical protein